MYSAAGAPEKYCEFSFKVAQIHYLMGERTSLFLSINWHGSVILKIVFVQAENLSENIREIIR